MVALAMLCLALGALFFYLSSPHQRWLQTPWTVRRGSGLGSACVVVALCLVLQVMQPTAAVFTWVNGLMFWLCLWPCVGALMRSRRASP